MTLTIEQASGAPAASSGEHRIIGARLPTMPLLDWVGWKVTGAHNRIADRLRERRLGIRTIGNVMIHLPDAHLYGTFAYRSVFRILHHMNMKPDDVFVDIGCGKGRIVCCAATLGIRKAIGVDLDGDLCGIARINAQQLRARRADIEIIHAPAQECDYRDCTQFFLFNPFGEQTLRQVASAICRSVDERPRTVQIAYVNPAYDHVFHQHSRFQRGDLWRWRPWSGLKFDVSFWRLG
jgi:SAM-dependent methyltransferase